MTTEHFQLQVIGSGVVDNIPASPLASLSQKTVVERSTVVGFSPNVVCLPGKKVTYSA
jgi:pyruvate/2-oxoglutarate dehydrogenase complex dihydrolipoamide dehydrogenase (E3) component